MNNRDTIAKTICMMCRINCGLDVHVENGRVVDVRSMKEHPLKVPPNCVKLQGMIEWVYSKDRLLNPLKKTNGKFKEISWDEAFEFIANKLSRIKQEYGARALLVHFGSAFIFTPTEQVARRFCDIFGTPNYTSGDSYCFFARVMGFSLTLGAPFILPTYGGEPECTVVWGNNPPESTPLQVLGISALRKRGGKLIVIDPRVTPIAKEADIYAQIRPGSDSALALGFLNVIINENLYDESFVKDWTIGFDKLVDHVSRFTPENVETITWVKAETIRQIARTYAKSKPASIAPGISLEHCTNGIQTIRAISILMAITGNFDIPGGNRYATRFEMENIRVGEIGRNHQVAEDAVGAQYPLYSQIVEESTAVPAIDQMLSEKPYPIKALIVHGGNPALTWPNANKVKKAFEKLDLVVVGDIFLTETAKLADIVLPGTTFLERKDLKAYRAQALPLVETTDRAIKPLGNSMEDWKIWVELAKKMGYGEYFPWENTDELFKYMLKPSGYSLEELKSNPGGTFYEKKGIRRYLESGFDTPSGKVEIYSETMKKHGYDPLPTFHEPMESFVSKANLSQKYPLLLITGARVKWFFHTQYFNVPILREHVPEPLIEINSNTAKTLGIIDEDMVKVESERGIVRIKAKVTDDIHPQVVSMPHAWPNEANANILTNDMERDPVSAFPGFRSILCRVIKDSQT